MIKHQTENTGSDQQAPDLAKLASLIKEIRGQLSQANEEKKDLERKVKKLSILEGRVGYLESELINATSEANDRARVAEKQLHAANERAEAAEGKVRQAEESARAAEARVSQAEERAKATKELIAVQKAQLALVNSQNQELEQRLRSQIPASLEEEEEDVSVESEEQEDASIVAQQPIDTRKQAEMALYGQISDARKPLQLLLQDEAVATKVKRMSDENEELFTLFQSVVDYRGLKHQISSTTATLSNAQKKQADELMNEAKTNFLEIIDKIIDIEHASALRDAIFTFYCESPNPIPSEIGYELRGDFVDNPDKKKAYQYFDVCRLVHDFKNSDELTTYLEKINGITEAVDKPLQQTLGEIYFYLLTQNHFVFRTHAGMKDIKESVEKSLREFEARIAKEAQETDRSEDTSAAKQLFGFIMLRKLELRDSNNVIIPRYRNYDNTQDYHALFTEYYQGLVTKKYEAISTITAMNDIQDRDSRNALQTQVKIINTANKDLKKVHTELKKINPAVFKEHYQNDEIELEVVKEMEDYLVTTKKSSSYNPERKTQAVTFFRGLNVNDDDFSNTNTRVQRLVTNAKSTVDTLNEEDKNKTIRHGSSSNLNKISQNLIEKFGKANPSDQTVKGIYDQVQELNKDWVNSLVRWWREHNPFSARVVPVAAP